MARDAFPGYDDPVNIEGEPEEALRALLSEDPEEAESGADAEEGEEAGPED